MKNICIYLLLLLNICLFSIQTVNADPIQIPEKGFVLNIAEMGAKDTFYIKNEFKVDVVMGLHVIYEDVTGTPDGQINIMESNNLDKLYIQVDSPDLPYTISYTDESVGFPKDGMPFKYVLLILDKNGMTGGYITILPNIKQY